jgi:hypothetical protein
MRKLKGDSPKDSTSTTLRRTGKESEEKDLNQTGKNAKIEGTHQNHQHQHPTRRIGL